MHIDNRFFELHTCENHNQQCVHMLMCAMCACAQCAHVRNVRMCAMCAMCSCAQCAHVCNESNAHTLDSQSLVLAEGS